MADQKLRLYQYTSIDEYSRYRILGAHPEQGTYSSADFLRKVVAAFARKGVQMECVQTDHGFEFTNRFSSSKQEIPTLFESATSSSAHTRPGTTEKSSEATRKTKNASMPPTVSFPSPTLVSG